MRGFTDEERNRIERALVDTAHESFTRHGFQKTNIRDITEPVGIAEGTFYQFFDSKSDIYLAVLLREQDSLIDTVEDELDSVVGPRDQIERLFRVWVDEFGKRPVLLKSHRDTQTLLSRLEGADPEKARAHIIDRMTPVIEDIQNRSDGYISTLTPRQVFEILSFVEDVAVKRDLSDRMGWSSYDEFKEILITVVTTGLAADPRPGSD